jgi:hypothetical protein
MEMGLAMLAQSDLPESFWVKSFLTAIFFINRLPTPLLKQRSLFSLLFEVELDYTSLRTFGAHVFPSYDHMHLIN